MGGLLLGWVLPGSLSHSRVSRPTGDRQLSFGASRPIDPPPVTDALPLDAYPLADRGAGAGDGQCARLRERAVRGARRGERFVRWPAHGDDRPKGFRPPGRPLRRDARWAVRAPLLLSGSRQLRARHDRTEPAHARTRRGDPDPAKLHDRPQAPGGKPANRSEWSGTTTASSRSRSGGSGTLRSQLTRSNLEGERSPTGGRKGQRSDCRSHTPEPGSPS